MKVHLSRARDALAVQLGQLKEGSSDRRGQARLAAGDLRSSVARSVSVEGSAGSQQPVAAAPGEQGVLAVLCIAAVTGSPRSRCVHRRTDRSPAEHPDGRADGVPCVGLLVHGDLPRRLVPRGALDPLTFSPSGELDVGSDTASVLDLDEPNDVYGLTVVANPRAADGGGGSTRLSARTPRLWPTGSAAVRTWSSRGRPTGRSEVVGRSSST